MKKAFSIFITFIIFISFVKAQSKSVLFLGNSYTAVNNLPQTLKDLSLALGDTITFDSNTPGGHTLQGHLTNSTSISKINQQSWDYVVLQEQSQLPSFSPSQVATDVYPFAHGLDSVILANDSCTETIFYMTWGRQNGDASNCAAYPPVCTYNGMQQRLRESYMEMGLNNHASVSPVGVAWKNLRDNYPSINLYQADQSHPSIHGTYLAACVFYSTIFHKSTLGASYIPADISSTDAQLIQTISSNTVLDSIFTWQGMGDIPNASFTYSGNNNTVNFSNTSFNSTNFNWDFGDGTGSTLINPQHLYTNPGVYTVTLSASTNCKQFVKTDTLTILPTTIMEKHSLNFNLYPNPTDGSVVIEFQKLEKNASVQLYNSIGQKVFEEKFTSINTIELNLRNYPSGIYNLVVQDNNGLLNTACLIKK